MAEFFVEVANANGHTVKGAVDWIEDGNYTVFRDSELRQVLAVQTAMVRSITGTGLEDTPTRRKGRGAGVM